MEIVFRTIRRNILIRTTAYLANKSTMATSIVQNEVDEAKEELKRNPFFEKYANKIATLQETSPEEFLARIEGRQTENKPKPKPADSRQYSSLLEPKKHLNATVEQQDKSLNNVMKIELIENKESKEIAEIWSKYHLNNDYISATIPSKSYEQLNVNAQKYPVFLFPIPRSQGYEFIVSQFFRNTVHFTPLLHYQVHKENAPECLTITHYTEFKNTKGIVLMRGEFDKNVLNATEAQCLANQLQLYYSHNDPKKIALLEQFTKKPDEFKHMELIQQIETLSL